MTGLPQLTGLGDEIGPALASLTDSIGTLLNPTAKFDSQLKQLFLEKPELMQKFVDVEKQNPGTLRAFGFGEGSTNFLSGMEESIPSIQQRLGRDLLESNPTVRTSAGAQAATGQTPGELIGDKVRAWLNQGGLQLMKDNPKAATLAMRKIVGLPSELDQETDADTLEALRAGKALKDLTPNQIVTRIVGGQLKVSDISAGLLNPQTEGGVKLAIQMWQNDRNADLRRELAKIGHAENNNSIFRAKLTAAIDQRKASGFLGSIAAHYYSIWGETPDGSEPNPEELKKVEEFQDNTEVGVHAKQQKALMSTIEPLLNEIQIRKKGQKPITEGEAKLKINQINATLKDAGIPWEARYDVDRFWFAQNRPKVVFTNKIGQVTDDPSVLVSPEIPPSNTIPRTAKPPQLSANEARTTAWLKSQDPETVDSNITKLYQAERAAGGDGSRTDAIIDAAGLNSADYRPANEPAEDQ